MKLSNLPQKGTSDWFPNEFQIRKYIFDTWRKVCIQFGYEEYLTPIVEAAEIYRAKSGEDIGGKELMFFYDKAGRELAIRPEMTPSVTRMVSRIYEASPKPLRLFSIANFIRNEKPQRGRNREFWQLNFDIFGSDSIEADIEILQVALEIMLAFNPPADSFVMFINNRKLIDSILIDIAQITESNRSKVVRILDKWAKLTKEDVVKELANAGLEASQISTLEKFMASETSEELIENFSELKETEGFIQITEIITRLESLGYTDYIKFQPNVIRGFDYYDGMIFEVFDKNPENNRAMFGGGRYNGLASLFGGSSFPAVGCAPGDETTKIFLESWNLIDQVYRDKIEKIFIPLIDDSANFAVNDLAKSLRARGKIVEVGIEKMKIGKALEYANKKEFSKVILIGENEIALGKYIEKDMATGSQTEKVL